MNDRIPGTTYDNPIWHGKWRIFLASLDAFAFGGTSYEFCHNDYDGPEDRRAGYATSVEDAKEQIDEYEEEHS